MVPTDNFHLQDLRLLVVGTTALAQQLRNLWLEQQLRTNGSRAHLIELHRFLLLFFVV